MTITTSRRAALAASAGIWAAIGGTAQAQTTPQQDQAVVSDEIIIVTAQKREELLIDVPQAVTVVGGDRLESLQADSFVDYTALVPGLSLEQNRAGASRLVLRGINTGSIGSTLGIYVDETPFGSSSSLGNAAILAGDFDTFDLDRIEVLRGPQGTLYGANALGGVLKFVTTAPRLGVLEARGQASVETVDSGGTGYSGNIVVNVPLGDSVAIRASGFYRRDAGFIDAVGRPAENINGSKSYGGRASVLFQPSDALSVRLTAIAQNIRANAPSVFDADPTSFDPVANDFVAGPAADSFTGAPLNGRLVFAQFFPDSSDVDYRLYNGTVDWDLGFASLTSATSYGILDQAQKIDGSVGLRRLVTGLYSAFAGNMVPLGVFTDQLIKQEKFTQEVRLASPETDTLEWLVGGYYTRETVALTQFIRPFNLATLAPINPAILGRPVFVSASLDSKYREYAAFGSVTWHVGPRFDISAGGRYSSNRQSSVQVLDGGLLALQGIPGAPITNTGGSSENVFTWSVSPKFEVNDHLTIYARVAKGYRPGGPNVVPPGAPADYPVEFDADTLVSYEAGIKAETADRSFTVDGAIYYLDWNNILVFSQFVTAIGPVGANDNGGGARSFGAEVTATVRPTRGLRFAFNGAYTDAELTDDTPPLVGGLDGDQLPYAPRWTANVSADYEWGLSDDATAFVGGSVRLVGDQAAGFEPAYRATFGRRLEVPGYQVVDLRAGARFGKFSLTAFAKNLANSRGLTSIAGFGGRPGTAIGASPIRPRTFGLTLGAGF